MAEARIKQCRGRKKRRRNQKRRHHTGPSISKRAKTPGKGRGKRATSKNHSGVRLSPMFGVYLGPCERKKVITTTKGKMPEWIRKIIAEREDTPRKWGKYVVGSHSD